MLSFDVHVTPLELLDKVKSVQSYSSLESVGLAIFRVQISYFPIFLKPMHVPLYTLALSSLSPLIL